MPEVKFACLGPVDVGAEQDASSRLVNDAGTTHDDRIDAAKRDLPAGAGELGKPFFLCSEGY